MAHPLRVLILEDNASDAELMIHDLRRAGFDPSWRRVETGAAFVAALDGDPEVILADHSLPGFDVFRALRHLRERMLDIPCLVITGTVGDEAAAECIKQGACDYLLKDRLARLGGAVLGALEQRRLGREKRLAENRLRERSEQLRAMAAELTLAEQRERRRLAEVLHDGIQQLLVGAKLRVQPLDRVADAQVREAGREVAGLLQEALEQTRSLTRELSPPILHAGGLIPALEWLGGWMAEKHGLKVVLGIEGTAGLKLEENLSILLFQSVRELLFNVVKHAKVQTARLEIKEQDKYVHIQVSDAGVGFDPARLQVEGGKAGSFGLFSIRQRLELLGGYLCSDSASGQGSRFALSAPLAGAQAVLRSAPTASGVPPRTTIQPGEGHLGLTGEPGDV